LLRPRRVPWSLRPAWLWGQSDTVRRRPRGVVGVIGTWNYPILLNGVQIAQALTAGNAVLWKPSELAPACATELHELMLRAGYPAELIDRLPATRGGGPLVTEADVDHVVFTGSAEVGRRIAARLGERLVREAVESGARLLTEHTMTPAGSAVWQPAAVADARPEMALCREATFAPVVAVLPFDDLGAALAADRQCPYALAASVFTRRPRQAEALVGRLRAGVVTVNDVVAPTAHPATPFGGSGASGWGVTQGAEGLLEMTVSQVVSVRAGRYRPHYDLAAGQGGGGHDELLRGLLEAGHAPTLGQRLRGWAQAARAAWRLR
jgi:aldehyde dehydrogenase (NAD+)